MGCGAQYYFRQLNLVSSTLQRMRYRLIDEAVPQYGELQRLRAKLIRQAGLTVPRTPAQILRLAGLSPGELRLWYDPELGWHVQARHGPDAPWVRRQVDDDVAATLIRGGLTHELEAALMAPEEAPDV